jgi:hypothetical protein
MISADDGACAVLVVRTDEELMIARHTRRLLFPPEPGRRPLDQGDAADPAWMRGR